MPGLVPVISKGVRLWITAIGLTGDAVPLRSTSGAIELEFVPVGVRAMLRQRFQISVVDQMNPHRHIGANVDRQRAGLRNRQELRRWCRRNHDLDNVIERAMIPGFLAGG